MMRVIYLFRVDYNSQDTWGMVELRDKIGIIGWNADSPSYTVTVMIASEASFPV